MARATAGKSKAGRGATDLVGAKRFTCDDIRIMTIALDAMAGAFGVALTGKRTASGKLTADEWERAAVLLDGAA